MEEKIRQELYDKLENELSLYKSSLVELSSKEIIDKSYETTMKEELIYFFYPDSKQFDLEEIKALKQEKNSLDSLYQGWMDCDLNICELLEDSVRDTLEDLVKEQKEKLKEMKNKSRER